MEKTKERRKSQDCKNFELKIDKSKLTKASLSYFSSLFTELKWVYNHFLSEPDIFHVDTKIDKVNALDKDRNPVVHDLKHISSQMKQAIHRRQISSINTLSTLKKQGKKVGRLKYRSRVDSVTLDQFGITYKIDGNFLRLQGNRNMKFKLLGLGQLPKDADIANAVLVRINNDFFLKVTCFVPKVIQESFPCESVGIDAGCSTTLTLSDGTKYDVKFPVSRKTRLLQRKLKNKPSHKTKSRKSKNCLKLYGRINKSIERTNARKKDRINKIVSEITNKFENICMQDENVKGWHSGNHGKAVQFSSVGGIIRDLQRKSHTFIEVDRFFPSTQRCSGCHGRQKVGLKERIFVCIHCGFVIDRDLNASLNILQEGLRIKLIKIQKLPMEYRDVKPVELMTSAIEKLKNQVNRKLLTLKQEVSSLSPGKVMDESRQRQEASAFRQG